MFGLAAQSQILGLSQAVLAGEIQTALSRLNELSRCTLHVRPRRPKPDSRFEPGRSRRRNSNRVEPVERTGAKWQGPRTLARRFAESFPQPDHFPGFARRLEFA